MRNRTMFVLGANGFIGNEVVQRALADGWTVKGLVRNEQASRALRELGAQPILGDAARPSEWIERARYCDVLVDLVQPKMGKRVTKAAIKKISLQRQHLTLLLLEALQSLPEAERPLFFYVSGTEDLEPDATGRIGSLSQLSPVASGFANIGIPVRKLIEASGVSASYICLGTVYGPGKVFADAILPQIARGKWRIVGDGSNRLPLVHLEDAARGIVHLAAQDRATTEGATFVLAESSGATAKDVFMHAASLMGARPPGFAPAWLASIFAGRVLVQTITQDYLIDPSGLSATGFTFKYPSHRQGMPPTLKSLGYRAEEARS